MTNPPILEGQTFVLKTPLVWSGLRRKDVKPGNYIVKRVTLDGRGYVEFSLNRIGVVRRGGWLHLDEFNQRIGTGDIVLTNDEDRTKLEKKDPIAKPANLVPNSNHTDFFNQPLKVGDYVAVEQPQYRNLVLGRIVSFTEKQVRIVYNNSVSTYKKVPDSDGVMWTDSFLTYPGTLVKKPETT